MNLQRFAGLPNVLKPSIVLVTLLTVIVAGAGGKSFNGGWFFWITLILQLVFMVCVCLLFLFEAENFLTFGRDAWPVAEMGYSGSLFVINVINMFIAASGKGGSSLVAALFIFLIAIMHAFSGFLMYRIWKGFVQSGSSQNPSGNVQPGDVGNMHPGV